MATRRGINPFNADISFNNTDICYIFELHISLIEMQIPVIEVAIYLNEM